MNYKRTLYLIFKEYLTKYPILAITGPRQSGKTTFLKTQFPDYEYVSLENIDHREFVKRDIKGFLARYSDRVIFDEVQQVPELFSQLQDVVDSSQKMGQYILSGSQNFNLMHNITQSLAGRVGIFKMLPFDLAEMKEANWLADDLSTAINIGFYPAIFDRKIKSDKYYADYVETYVKRDVSQLLNIQDQRTFRNFIKLCAARAGQLLNYSDLAKDAGVSHTTARNWLSILETSFIVHFLDPYYKNYNKRVIKSPKLYFYDTGLLCYLLNIKSGQLDPSLSQYGHIYECFVLNELLKQNEHQMLLREYWFWRDSKGKEIDLFYTENEKTHIAEIKATTTITSKLFKAMDDFERISTDTIASKTLFYGGKENQKRTRHTIVGWDKLDWQ
jgi:predicted AAA+ superfamily ATPase